MKIYRQKGEKCIIHPFVERRPIINDDGTKSEIYSINENSELYKNGVKQPLWYDENGRPFCSANLGSGLTRYPAYRLAKIAFEDDPKPYSFYSNLQCDHIDPTIPVDNHISNLEFVSRAENMRRAAIKRQMEKCYTPELVHNICQMICDNVPRYEIRQKLGVNGQLIDDIRAGRSHKVISEQYISKGFKYKVYDREYKEKIIRQICTLIEKGTRTCDIVRMFPNDDFVNYNFVDAIKGRRTFIEISKDYKF